MNLEILPLKEEMYREWTNFCFKSDSAWFRHTTYFLEYVLNCRFDKKSKNLSFMIYQNNKIVAIVPLILQTIYEDPEIFEFAMGDTPIPYPSFCNSLEEENRKGITKIIFEEIDKIAKENNIQYSKFFLDPLSEEIINGKQKFNPLLKFGYNEASLSTNIIFLGDSENEIFSNISKGHKADIKTGIKNRYVVDIFDQINIQEEIFNIYKNLHFLAAGRKTRPEESWKDMFRFIKEGYSILALEREVNSDQYFAGIFVVTYKQKGYYGSGATHPEFERIRGIGHLLHWEVIKYLKRNGYKYYETGWNFYPIISCEVPCLKELNISRFKSGFGGNIYPLFRGEKFYDYEYMEEIMRKRIEKLKEVKNEQRKSY